MKSGAPGQLLPTEPPDVNRVVSGPQFATCHGGQEVTNVELASVGLFSLPAQVRSLAMAASSVCSVSRPVKVLCWLTW